MDSKSPTDNPRTFVSRYWNAAWQFPRLLWEERHWLFDDRSVSHADLPVAQSIGLARQLDNIPTEG